MSYEDVEAGLQVEIRATATLTDEQVSLHDWLILGYGHAQVAILEYLGFTAERDSSDLDTLFRWVVRINLLVKYTDDASGNNLLRDIRDEIVVRILQNPKLNSTAFDSLPIAGNVSEEEEIVIGGVRFLHEWIDVAIEERVNA